MTNVIASIAMIVVTNVTTNWDVQLPYEITYTTSTLSERAAQNAILGGVPAIFTYTPKYSTDQCRVVTEVKEQTRTKFTYGSKAYDLLLEEKVLSKKEHLRTKKVTSETTDDGVRKVTKTTETWEDGPDIEFTSQYFSTGFGWVVGVTNICTNGAAFAYTTNYISHIVNAVTNPWVLKEKK